MSDEETKKLCYNCKYKMLGWRCLKAEHLDCVKGKKWFDKCEDHRTVFGCGDYRDKKPGRSKTENQLAIVNEVSYIATVVSASLAIAGFFAFMTALVIRG